mmetsp:Transcript_59526/g.98078  ORF Transcript_59526/g.98078 Transcript_59526/m.98078 type:complete len:207 (+) Transcript_59526:446-1066(+)
MLTETRLRNEDIIVGHLIKNAHMACSNIKSLVHQTNMAPFLATPVTVEDEFLNLRLCQLCCLKHQSRQWAAQRKTNQISTIGSSKLRKLCMNVATCIRMDSIWSQSHHNDQAFGNGSLRKRRLERRKSSNYVHYRSDLLARALLHCLQGLQLQLASHIQLRQLSFYHHLLVTQLTVGLLQLCNAHLHFLNDCLLLPCKLCLMLPQP